MRISDWSSDVCSSDLYAGRSILISPPGTAEASIAPLPIAALRLPSALVDNLRTLGFDRIGDLLAQPRAPLTLRFGPELGRRIDQALGLSPELIDPIRPEGLRSDASRVGKAGVRTCRSRC